MTKNHIAASQAFLNHRNDCCNSWGWIFEKSKAKIKKHLARFRNMTAANAAGALPMSRFFASHRIALGECKYVALAAGDLDDWMQGLLSA
jgi:hypothetical protein